MEQQYQYVFNVLIILFLVIGTVKFYEINDTVEMLKKMFEEIEKRLNRLLEEMELVISENKELKECKCHNNCEQTIQVNDIKSAAKVIKDMCAENETCQHCPFRQADGLCILSINQDGISNGYTPDTWNLD